MKRILCLGLVLASAVGLAACSASGAGSPSSSSSASSSEATSSVSSSSSSSSVEAVGAEDVVTIGLDYSAGTGYEWRCTVEPAGVVSQVGRTTQDLSEGENLDGGPLQDQFTFRAASAGEVVITFGLVRGWESDDEPAETQVYAFTVSDDLKMALNPYKSQFENEPEWGSNS